MSYTQFGYSTYAASSPLVLGGSSGQNSCYERTGVSPELYPRLSSYAPSYQTDAPPTLDPTTTPFYAPAALNSTYGMKESSDPWRSISQSASYYYDPTLAAYGYGGLDFNGARRKNVTRDSTSTLKAWLNEHRKNPYPTKGEKIMLAIITKMTLTQVSTWFANARRRLKKENKMTWEPRNKAEAHDDDKREDDGKEEDSPAAFREEDTKPLAMDSVGPTEMDPLVPHHRDDTTYRPSSHHPMHQPHFSESSHPDLASSSLEGATSSTSGYTPSSQSSSPDHMSYLRPTKDHFLSSDLYKPKIWSLADTATNKVVDPSLMPFHSEPCTQGGGGGWGVKGVFQSCAAPFQRYGHCGLHTGISLQTDTPPQTPPNMKVTTGHTVPSSATSYIEAYMGQSSLCQSAEAQLQDDKMDNFPSNHGSGLPQSSSSNQNTASDCISEDFDDPSQYSTSSVR